MHFRKAGLFQLRSCRRKNSAGLKLLQKGYPDLRSNVITLNEESQQKCSINFHNGKIAVFLSTPEGSLRYFLTACAVPASQTVGVTPIPTRLGSHNPVSMSYDHEQNTANLRVCGTQNFLYRDVIHSCCCPPFLWTVTVPVFLPYSVHMMHTLCRACPTKTALVGVTNLDKGCATGTIDNPHKVCNSKADPYSSCLVTVANLSQSIAIQHWNSHSNGLAGSRGESVLLHSRLIRLVCC
jgi:hypothetical protein